MNFDGWAYSNGSNAATEFELTWWLSFNKTSKSIDGFHQVLMTWQQGTVIKFTLATLCVEESKCDQIIFLCYHLTFQNVPNDLNESLGDRENISYDQSDTIKVQILKAL